jgi:hypothetical protein
MMGSQNSQLTGADFGCRKARWDLLDGNGFGHDGWTENSGRRRATKPHTVLFFESHGAPLLCLALPTTTSTVKNPKRTLPSWHEPKPSSSETKCLPCVVPGSWVRCCFSFTGECNSSSCSPWACRGRRGWPRQTRSSNHLGSGQSTRGTSPPQSPSCGSRPLAG